MDPDQTAPKGAVWSEPLLFAYMKKSNMKCTWIYAADVKGRLHFQDKIVFVCLIWFRTSHQ